MLFRSMKVVQTRFGRDYLPENSVWEEKQAHIAGEIVGELREVGRLSGVQTAGEIRKGPDIADCILKVADDEGVDLIILGSNIRVGSDRLYLGPKVEHILNDAPCPVVVINTR